MSRISPDLYKLHDGSLVPIGGMDSPPEGSTLWQGFDYDKQEWIFEGKKDTRLRLAASASVQS